LPEEGRSRCSSETAGSYAKSKKEGREVQETRGKEKKTSNLLKVRFIFTGEKEAKSFEGTNVEYKDEKRGFSWRKRGELMARGKKKSAGAGASRLQRGITTLKKKKKRARIY